jgi:hypothetical protein
MAPAEIICTSITPGKTSAMPASASVPSRDTNQVSISPVAACASMTSTLGHAMCSRLGTISPSSWTRVRGSSAIAWPGAATAAREIPSGAAPSVSILISRSVCG